MKKIKILRKFKFILNLHLRQPIIVQGTRKQNVKQKMTANYFDLNVQNEINLNGNNI